MPRAIITVVKFSTSVGVKKSADSSRSQGPVGGKRLSDEPGSHGRAPFV